MLVDVLTSIHFQLPNANFKWSRFRRKGKSKLD